MKTLNYLKIVILIILFNSCSKDSEPDNNNNLNNFVSAICDNAVGPTGAYWDNAHGLPIPLTQIPTLANPGQQFIHSQYPALGFTMPQGYTAQETQIGLGVNVFKNNGNGNKVRWRYVPGLSSFSQVDILDIVTEEVNAMFAFHENQGGYTVDCEQNFSQQQGSFLISTSTRLLRFGNTTGLVAINSYFDTTTGSTYASVSTASGPTAEFDSLVMNDFLPIHWQLLIIDDNVRDSDLDGTPDNQDNFPFDSTRQ
ncbi:hypothetical protein [Winogradskyella forsetii]|uniref:hypothetical protein n=1 Tax=Winogradskyella forsetii TaxID=2686077 RepID=UPI0015BEFFF6|nr:hypothetical protein [Winogradskyella forsetii]